MGYKNREIEVKLLVESAKSYTQVNQIVSDFMEVLYPDFEKISGRSYDLYWAAPKDSNADFIRLRRTDDRRAVITLKASDNGNNVDRVEIDLEVDDYDQSKEILIALRGDPVKLTKRYDVYFLENSDTNISVYQVSGDDKVFIEVEGRTSHRVNELCHKLNNLFCHGMMINLHQVNNSLYQMYIQKRPMRTTNLTEYLKRGKGGKNPRVSKKTKK